MERSLSWGRFVSGYFAFNLDQLSGSWSKKIFFGIFGSKSPQWRFLPGNFSISYGNRKKNEERRDLRGNFVSLTSVGVRPMFEAY